MPYEAPKPVAKPVVKTEAPVSKPAPKAEASSSHDDKVLALINGLDDIT